MEKTENTKKEESIEKGVEFLLEQGWGEKVNVEAPEDDEEMPTSKEINKQLTF